MNASGRRRGALAMPYHDEEYPGQPLWQSVLLFCCKGMIEGIMVLLFFWLLVQVLFTKQLEGEAQDSEDEMSCSYFVLCFWAPNS